MPLDKEQLDIIHDLIRDAIPVSPQPDRSFVSREEFTTTISLIEEKIENSNLRNRNWVLGGCVAILIAGVAGWGSLVSRLDGLGKSMPALEVKMEERAAWMQRVEQRNVLQDEALRKLDPNYHPLPYKELPQ